METRKLDGNALTGSTELFHFDHAEDKFHIEEREDITELVDTNRALRNDTVRDKFGGEMHRIASIPMNIYMDLQAQGIAGDPKRFKAWLNDRDNRVFRTHEAVV